MPSNLTSHGAPSRDPNSDPGRRGRQVVPSIMSTVTILIPIATDDLLNMAARPGRASDGATIKQPCGPVPLWSGPDDSSNFGNGCVVGPRQPRRVECNSEICTILSSRSHCYIMCSPGVHGNSPRQLLFSAIETDLAVS
jgi:hypothetical protein